MGYEISKLTDNAGEVIYEVWHGIGDVYAYMDKTMLEEYFSKGIEELSAPGMMWQESQIDSVSEVPPADDEMWYSQSELRVWAQRNGGKQ